MGRDYTTVGLLRSIEIRGAIPIDRLAFDEDDILQIADEELQTMIVPLIMAHRAHHFLDSEDTTLTAAVAYPIAEQAINRGLQNVVLVASDGSESALLPIDKDREFDANRVGYALWWRSHRSPSLGYYIVGDELVLFPESRAGETLRQYFYRLPNKLVQTSEAALVVSVHGSNGEVTCVTGTVPAAWDTGTRLCVVSGRPGFGLVLAATVAVTATTTVVDLDPADAALIEAGDWIALEGESPIPQIPIEVMPILSQSTVVKIRESMSDPAVGVAQEKLNALMQAYIATHKLRVEQAPKKILPPGSGGVVHWVR